jgi:S1-C subfamily serine protease
MMQEREVTSMFENNENNSSFATPFGPQPQPPSPSGPPEPAQTEPEWARVPETPPAYTPPPVPPYNPSSAPYAAPVGAAFSRPPEPQPAVGARPVDAPYTQPQQGYGATRPPEPATVGAAFSRPPEPAPATAASGVAAAPPILGLSRKNMALIIVILIIACVASGVGGGFLGSQIGGRNAQVAGVASATGEAQSITISPTTDITVTEAVAKKVLPSVVGITSAGTVVTEDFFFGSYEQEVEGVGTGMIIDKAGYILTNSHVVMDGSVDSIKVLLNTGEEKEGQVIWNDSSLDLAIVKIEGENLEPVEIGSSADIQIGSYVAAIGNPLGLEFKSSVTQGVVSGLDRSITVTDETGANATTMEGLIQVDAAINSGNSGGPLLNSLGQVIGVNTAKASAEGMGFAIPIDTAAPIIEKVIRDGNFERVYMGVSAADVSVIRENYPNVELKADEGACITDVNPGSPAEKAGLKVKDVVTAVDGKAVTGSAGLVKLLLNYSAGDVVNVTVNRDGEVLDLSVTLVSQTEIEQIEQEQNPFKNPPQQQEQPQQNGRGYSDPYAW